MTTIDHIFNGYEPRSAITAAAGGDSAVDGDGLRCQVTLSVIVPTRNETESVGALLGRLRSALPAGSEVLFVDDSDDATGYRVRRLCEDPGNGGIDVRLVHRPRELRSAGLGGAVTLGLRRARGEWVAVMDADLQHPPELLAEMLHVGQSRGVDVVVASRYLHQASDASLSAGRRLVSRSFAGAARVAFPRRLHAVTDPLSGYFLLRRDQIDPTDLRPSGFKILLEILGRFPNLTVAEIGYEFSERYAGVSKASAREGLRYVRQLQSLRTARNGGDPAARYRYDVQGLLTVESEQYLPELSRFRVRPGGAPADIRVRAKTFRPAKTAEYIDLCDAEPRVRYQEPLGRLGFVAELAADTRGVEVAVSRLVMRSPHVLYTNVVEPILRWQLVKRGFALVHAAAVEGRDGTCLITARTDTGKTTTMLKLLDEADYRFVSDDLVLLDSSGRILSYPKPLTISRHTVHALRRAELTRTERAALVLQSRIHSRGGRRFAFELARKGLPVATINTLTQMIVPPPKYHVERLVPGVAIGGESKLRRLVIIERGADTAEILPGGEAVEILLENCADAYGFPPYDSLERFFYAIDGTRFQEAERRIITSAMAGVPSHLIASSTMNWAREIADLVAPLELAARPAA